MNITALSIATKTPFVAACSVCQRHCHFVTKTESEVHAMYPCSRKFNPVKIINKKLQINEIHFIIIYT